MFSGLFSALMAKIRGRTALNSSAKKYFLQPLLSYFAELSAIWQQCLSYLLVPAGVASCRTGTSQWWRQLRTDDVT